MAGVCPRRGQLPTRNLLGGTFMPKGLPDLLVGVLDNDYHDKTPQAAVVFTSPKKREVSVLQESYFRPHLAQLPPLGLGS